MQICDHPNTTKTVNGEGIHLCLRYILMVLLSEKAVFLIAPSI